MVSLDYGPVKIIKGEYKGKTGYYYREAFRHKNISYGVVHIATPRTTRQVDIRGDYLVEAKSCRLRMPSGYETTPERHGYKEDEK